MPSEINVTPKPSKIIQRLTPIPGISHFQTGAVFRRLSKDTGKPMINDQWTMNNGLDGRSLFIDH